MGTVCPISLVHVYIVTHYIRIDKTSSRYSTISKGFLKKKGAKIAILMILKDVRGNLRKTN